MINENLRPDHILPIIVHNTPETTQLYFEITIGITMVVTLMFLPCLLFLVAIQIQNFWLNQTTNTRFSRFKRGGLTEAQLNALQQERESSDSDHSGLAFNDRSHDRDYSRLENSLEERTGATSFFGMICNGNQARANGQVNALLQDPNRFINQPIGLEKRDLIERQRHRMHTSPQQQEQNKIFNSSESQSYKKR